jgi:hypothetical protein
MYICIVQHYCVNFYVRCSNIINSVGYFGAGCLVGVGAIGRSTSLVRLVPKYATAFYA